MPIEFVTRIGETKIATLSDGTEIDINTDTRIMVSLDRGFRRVTLDYGEALFHVAKDPVRPFIVTVGDRTVRDVGTVFNILHSNGVTTVTVAEGRVGVSPSFPANRHKEVVLLAGDQLVHADGTASATVEHVDPAEALAWRRGYLVYRNAPLSKVASDLGRYFTVPIRLNDNRVAAQKFTGVLRLDSESAVLRRITILLPVTIEYGPDGKITLRMSD
jgi:transmembrane sensor